MIDVLDCLENRQSTGIGQILSEGQETRAPRIAIRSCFYLCLSSPSSPPPSKIDANVEINTVPQFASLTERSLLPLVFRTEDLIFERTRTLGVKNTRSVRISFVSIRRVSTETLKFQRDETETGREI